MRVVVEIPPEMTTETVWECSVEGCSSVCFDREFAEQMGCAIHGFKWRRVVRQFENGKMISEFKEKL